MQRWFGNQNENGGPPHLVLAVWLSDHGTESIYAPPTNGGDVRATFKLLIEADAEEARIGSEMIALWTRCLTNRLQLERDLGVLDADTWPAFLARFQARPAPTP